MNEPAPQTDGDKLASQGSPRKRSPVGILIVVVAVICVGATTMLYQSGPSAGELIQQAQRSLRMSKFEDALTQTETAIEQGEDTPATRLLAGEAALKLERYSDALRHLESIDDTAGPDALAARLSSASMLIHQHQVGEAEAQLRRALKLDPQNEQAYRLMSETLGLQGRRWESIEYLRYRIQQGDIDLPTLCYMADTDRMVDLSEEQLASFLESDNPKCWLGAACVAISYRDFDKAETLIRKCLAAEPDLAEAHVRLAKLLLSDSDDSAMQQWEADLPATANLFPEIWFIRSEWCLKRKDHKQAAACLWRALSINPDHPAANHQMGHVLSILGRKEEAEPFLERGQRLTRLSTLANQIYLGDSRSGPLKESAEIVEALERPFEAMGWAVAAEHENPGEQWPVAMQSRLQPFIANDATPATRQTPAALLSFADRTWTPPQTVADAGSLASISTTSVSFRDATADAGIVFKYENAEDLSTPGRLMFEYTGGGVGVLDYDQDGWPDLYFTQGGSKSPFSGQTEAVDTLLRNRRGTDFVDAGPTTGIRDFGFGQGVAAGDINNDGFPDLYVANIDGNRLYLNQGDGTFTDATAQSGLGHEFWTTSVAIADLDGDSTPDIYDVTFLSDPDVFTRICEDDGVARSCAPAGFTAAEDFVYRGIGDGAFEDLSKTAGIHAPDGDGLGILIADFSATGTPSIFIANDGRANFYFTQESPSASSTMKNGELKFSEDALSRGLAFDRDGRAQACMGIASSDFDGDGLWDLFVTNFFNESNTLYTQFPGENFGDSSQQAGIREPSLGMLGFGTQAIDGELDGWEDVLVGNGHVDNFEHKGIPYQMPLEYYRNTGEANFTQNPFSKPDSTLAEPMLSRSMAVIDWNGDGKAEVAISRLDAPALLLENTTQNAGNSVVIRLVGIDSSRDATTARLSATVAGRKVIRQLTAGDGYQSSNQKQVIFGLGTAEMIENLTIAWPSGQSQVIGNVLAGQTVTVREGDPQAWPMTTSRQVD